MDFLGIFAGGVRSMLAPEAAIYALAAIGLNVHFGYTGLLNFGQVGFMLVGAYGLAATVATFGSSLWLGLLVGAVCAVVLSLILGAPTLRLRSDYLAIATIAAAEVLRFVYRSSVAEPVTGGVYGLQQFAGSFYALNPIPSGSYGVGVVSFSERALWVMAVSWGLVALATVLVYLLVHSPWGRVLRAIREDEDAARSLGKNIYSYKMQALVLGGVLAGVAGMLLAMNQQSAHPDTYFPVVTFYLYTLLILGGAGRVLGPVLGSVIFWFLISFADNLLREAIATGLIPTTVLSTAEIGAVRFALVGLGLILLMAFRPAGILGNRRELMLDAR